MRKLQCLFFGRKPDFDIEDEFMTIYAQCKSFTMTSFERMYALYKATEYLIERDIPGDIVECGVYRGGSAMVCALTLQKMHQIQKCLYLYDTYEGMSEPTGRDVSCLNENAYRRWVRLQKKELNQWCYAPLEQVKENMLSTGYPLEKLRFIKGKVEQTIPREMPARIALLRLDTDWYESTYHELTHLFPRLVQGGVIILDDYGYWKGSREATDKYFAENKIKILLNRIDATGRIGVKLT